MYEEILIPIDGSGIFEKSIKELDNLNLESPKLHLISVVDYSVFGNHGPTDAERVAYEDEKECEEKIESARKELSEKGYEVEPSIVKGWPAASIVDYAENNGIDLIIMTTHGDKNITDSVSHKTIDMTDIPVLLKGSMRKV